MYINLEIFNIINVYFYIIFKVTKSNNELNVIIYFLLDKMQMYHVL